MLEVDYGHDAYIMDGDRNMDVNVCLSTFGQQWIGNSFYQTFFDYSPLPMGLCKVIPGDLINLQCNIAAAKFFGRSPAEVCGRTSYSMGAPKLCIAEWHSCYQKSITIGQPCSTEYTSECADGVGVKWFRCTIYPIHPVNPSEKSDEVFAYIIHDITERKVAELQVLKMKDELETIINSVDCIVWEVNATDGKFTFVSEQSERILGYPASHWVDFGSFMEQILHPEDKSVLACLGPNNSRSRAVKYRAKKRNGDVVWIRSVINKSTWGTYYGVMMDVSDAQRSQELEAEKKEISLRLKHKSEFVAGISHEIRTPLNGIIGMISLALEDPKISQNSGDYLQASLNCADSLLSIVNDVLDFAKIEAGKMNIEMIPFNLRRVIEETVNLLAVKAEEKDLDLILDYDSLLDEDFIGDSNRIRQILTNLVVNATKFTAQGHVLVVVKKEGGDMKVTVSDTGVGIRADQVDRLFNDYQQADISVSRIYGGTGLGLSISKQLVKLMNGQIGVKSVFGEGSDFWFTLPLEVREVKVPQTLTLSVPMKSGSISALLIFSNPNMSRILEKQLKLWNQNINSTVAKASSRVSELLNDRSAHHDAHPPYDLIIFESELEEDEKSLLEIFCSSAELQKVPLIAVSKLSHRNKWNSNNFGHEHVKWMSHPLHISNLYRILNDTHLFESQKEPEKKLRPSELFTLELDYTPKILIVDDNAINQKIATKMLEKFSLVEVADCGSLALQKIKNAHESNAPYDIVFMDIMMPGVMNGYQTSVAVRDFEVKKEVNKQVTIIALTASVTDMQKCAEAQMQGFITKPFRMQDFRKTCQKYLRSARS